ncbi:hypothetical protein [Larkinella punicea]|uniref:Uncharacterized protein n=1 Tax=Larkinella punicea TaxID=2315727 RepID=A0A368JIA8_9BACT|nr:hypothetical protein [Larkinella punicea]RCR67025.1 hypothetical protein DUE52_23495 [Larkinella punicea]
MKIEFDDLTDWKSGHIPHYFMDAIVDYLKSNPSSTVEVKTGDETTVRLFLKEGQIWEGAPIADSGELVPTIAIYTLPVSSNEE